MMQIKRKAAAVGLAAMVCTAAVASASPAYAVDWYDAPTVAYTPTTPTVDPNGGVQVGGDYGIAAQINTERIRAGKRPLPVSWQNEVESRACSRENILRRMNGNYQLQHCRYETLYWRSSAIPMPAASSPVRAWMASPPHREMLLSDRVSAIGVGWAAHPTYGVVMAATMDLRY